MGNDKDKELIAKRAVVYHHLWRKRYLAVGSPLGTIAVLQTA